MENEIDEKSVCDRYVETNIGVEALALELHVGKKKIKEILSKNGIEVKKRGGQVSKENYLIKDWRKRKYEKKQGFEYIVFDEKTNFKTKDIENKAGIISNYINKVYGVVIPSLYDRRKYYKLTGNYWWEQWLSVKRIEFGTEKCKIYTGDEKLYVEDNITNVVLNRNDKKNASGPSGYVEGKITKKEKKTRAEKFIEKSKKTHPGQNLDYSKVEYIDKRTPVYIIDHDLRPDGTEYGGYWQRPENHVRGASHPDKSRDRQRELFSFGWNKLVKMFKEKHPNENIEYPEQDNYVNLNSKIRFIDHDLRPDGTEYGEVWQIASEHLKGRMHPRKYFDSRIGKPVKNKKTNEEFITECSRMHSNFYSYGETKYNRNFK